MPIDRSPSSLMRLSRSSWNDTYAPVYVFGVGLDQLHELPGHAHVSLHPGLTPKSVRDAEWRGIPGGRPLVLHEKRQNHSPLPVREDHDGALRRVDRSVSPEVVVGTQRGKAKSRGRSEDVRHACKEIIERCDVNSKRGILLVEVGWVLGAAFENRL